MCKILLSFTLMLMPYFLMAQVNISGIVNEANSEEPMIGVSVFVEGTDVGTITGVDGKFHLSVPEGSVKLSFRYMGYKSLTINTNGQKTLFVNMSEDLQTLDEVVVVGYGTQKRETLVGSISSIKSKSLVTVPASNLTQSLAGKATGVSVVQSTGEIGRDEADIYIRGQATFDKESSKPLIVVDGIIRESFAQIDANEVESINILKDASATAVFGVKGANGVIIVTTKRGITGKAKVSFSSQIAVNTPMRLHTPIDGYRTALLKNELDDNRGNQSSYSANQLMNWRTGASPYTEPDVDWMDEIMKSNSIQQQYNVNVSGGTKTVRYFISTGYFNQDSPFKDDNITNFKRYNFRSNLDLDVAKDLKFSLNMGARIEDRKYPTAMYWNTWEIYRAAFSQSGIKYPVYNMDGSYAPNNVIARIQDSGTSTNNTTVVEIGLSGEYKLDWLLKGLAVKGQVAYDDRSGLTKMYGKTPAIYEYIYETDIYSIIQSSRPLSYSWDDVSNTRKLYWEGAMTYDLDRNKHSINALILYNQLMRGTNEEQLYASMGLVGRVVYNYSQKYLAEVNFGLNGSENFSVKNRFGVFPSFSLGWVISREKFWEQTGINSVVNNLKFRASLGWVGNDRSWINNEEQRFLFLSQYTYNGGYMFGDNTVVGVRQDKIENADVTWEKSRKFNIGFESALFNNLFTLDAEYFHEYRSDILWPSDKVPSYVGAELVPGNIGKTQNQGVEIDFSHINKVHKDFTYNVRLNFSFARNKVLEKGTPEGVLFYQRSEGFPINTPLKFITIGYFQSYEEIENSPSQLGISGNSEVNPGDLKYMDINGDNIIDRYDMIRTGFPTVPEILYGVTLGFNWKSFDFSCLLQGTTNVSFDKNWEIMWAFSNNDNVFSRHWYYWTPETGDEYAQYTQLYGKYYNNEAGADYTLSDGSYLRLKNVDLGYTFPVELTKKFYVNNLRIYISALNLLTWSKEKGLDPDNRSNRGGRMPPMQTVSFGLNVNF